MFDLIQKVLGDDGCECLEKTSLQTFRRFVSHLQGCLQQSKRELLMRFSGNPQSEFLVNLVISWFKNSQQLFHELKTQVTILKHDPTSGLEAFLHDGQSFHILTFSHRNSLQRIFLLLLGQLFNRRSWIRTGRQQEKNRF